MGVECVQDCVYLVVYAEGDGLATLGVDLWLQTMKKDCGRIGGDDDECGERGRDM
jgi:hypothetical protein